MLINLLAAIRLEMSLIQGQHHVGQLILVALAGNIALITVGMTVEREEKSTRQYVSAGSYGTTLGSWGAFYGYSALHDVSVANSSGFYGGGGHCGDGGGDGGGDCGY